MTDQYATDTSHEDIIEEENDKELEPLKVEITNKEKEKNPTSEDSIDYSYLDATLTDEEIKEMTDAQ